MKNNGIMSICPLVGRVLAIGMFAAVVLIPSNRCKTIIKVQESEVY